MGETQAKLVYDSASTGARTGTRSSIGAERTLLFLSNELSVDVVVQLGSEGMRFFHGQVTEMPVGSPLPGARVRIGDEDQVSVCDNFGQFAIGSFVSTEPQALHVEAGEVNVFCTVPKLEEPTESRG